MVMPKVTNEILKESSANKAVTVMMLYKLDRAQ